MSDLARFIDENAGSQYPAFKFDAIGATAKGRITRVVHRDMPNKFNGGVDPTLIVELEDEAGNGVTVYAKRGFMLSAIADAVRRATGGTSEMEVGATLAVRYDEDRDTGKPQPAKVFKAQYQPPVVHNTVNVDDLL